MGCAARIVIIAFSHSIFACLAFGGLLAVLRRTSKEAPRVGHIFQVDMGHRTAYEAMAIYIREDGTAVSQV